MYSFLSGFFFRFSCLEFMRHLLCTLWHQSCMEHPFFVSSGLPAYLINLAAQLFFSVLTPEFFQSIISPPHRLSPWHLHLILLLWLHPWLSESLATHASYTRTATGALVLWNVSEDHDLEAVVKAEGGNGMVLDEVLGRGKHQKKANKRYKAFWRYHDSDSGVEGESDGKYKE